MCQNRQHLTDTNANVPVGNVCLVTFVAESQFSIETATCAGAHVSSVHPKGQGAPRPPPSPRPTRSGPYTGTVYLGVKTKPSMWHSGLAGSAQGLAIYRHGVRPLTCDSCRRNIRQVVVFSAPFSVMSLIRRQMSFFSATNVVYFLLGVARAF